MNLPYFPPYIFYGVCVVPYTDHDKLEFEFSKSLKRHMSSTLASTHLGSNSRFDIPFIL